MTREEAKSMAQSRDCSCVKGKDRDNNYNECIDKIFDWLEQARRFKLYGYAVEVVYRFPLLSTNLEHTDRYNNKVYRTEKDAITAFEQSPYYRSHNEYRIIPLYKNK